MPEVGDRVRGSEIGRSDRWYIWVECEDCKAGRWVQDNGVIPVRCQSCARNIHRNNFRI